MKLLSLRYPTAANLGLRRSKAVLSHFLVDSRIAAELSLMAKNTTRKPKDMTRRFGIW